MRILSWCVAVLIWASGELYAQETLYLDLRGAVSYALSYSPAFRSFATHEEISTLTVKNARISLFPKIHMSASLGLSALNPEWQTKNNNGLTLNLEQPILSNSTNSLVLNRERTRSTIAHLETLHQRDLLCMKVAKEFFAHALANEQLQIKKHKLAILVKQLDVVNARYQQGLKRERDVLRFKAKVKQAQIVESSARNRVDQAKQALVATITGTNLQELSLNFEFDVSQPRLDLAAIPKNKPAILNHIVFKKLEHERTLALLDVDFARRQLWPEISASLGTTFGNSLELYRPFDILPSHAITLGLSFRFELFDFGKRRRDVVIAGKNREIKENAIHTQLATETLAIANLMSSLELLRESLIVNQSLLILEDANFKRIETDYLQGKAQYLDVISALDELSEVKSALSAALFDLQAQIVTHRYYEGTLYDWIF